MRKSKKTERFTAFSKYERRLIFLPVAFLVVSEGLSVFPGALFGALVHEAQVFLRKGRGEVLEKVKIFLEGGFYDAAKAQSKVQNSEDRGLALMSPIFGT
jgi:hypothetical protein